MVSALNGFILLATFLTASAEFEDLSTSDLENLLENMQYEDAYDPAYDYPPVEYNYDQYGDNNGLAEEDLLELQQRQAAPQSEIMDHGIPLSMMPAEMPSRHKQPIATMQAPPPPPSSSGTTKANVPKGSGAVLPAYCDPPNPCPIGYSDKDGCIEDFENTSEFSRNYQSQQNCLCDSEHMFNCPAEEPQRPKVDSAFLAGLPPSLGSEFEGDNPYLSGNKLPIAAKKGLGF